MKNLVPLFIQNQYRKGCFAGQMQAVTMFVDISGFTRMTDALMQHRKDGIETLSDILSYVFGPTVRSIYKGGGFVSTYAGDAFTALFPVESDPVQVAQRALAAAQEIIQFFRVSGKYECALGQFAFSAKVGLGLGPVEWAIVGDDAARLFYFRGDAIDACAQAEHHAVAGEIWAEDAFMQAAMLNPSLDRAQGRFVPLDVQLQQEFADVEIASPIFSASEMRLFSGEAEFDFPEGEFREVISAFIAWDELPDMQSFLQMALMLQRRYGGSHLQLDFGDKGSKMVLFFGTPVTHENKEEHALQFIRELWRQMPALAKVKAGLTRGVVYTGFYGSPLQQAFSCLGSAVNQAARFMARAEWGQVLCDGGLAKTPGHTFTYLGDFSYKGRSQPIPTYALQAAAATEAVRSSRAAAEQAHLLIGRENELRFLHHALQPLQEGRFGGVLYVDGEAGLGKSRLLQTFRQQTAQFRWFVLPCDEVLRKSLNPLVYFLNGYFEQDQASSAEEKQQRFEARFNQLLQQTRDANLTRELKRGRPFLGALLQLPQEEAQLRQFDAQARYENTLDALKVLFKAESAQQPLILHLEDAHWIDPDSRDFFRLLTRNVEDCPFLLLTACRYQDDGSLFELSLESETPVQRLTLGPLSESEAGKLIAFVTRREAAVPPATLAFIHQRSSGNPFFIEQITLYLIENQLLDEQNNLDERLLSGQAELEIPATINAILVARIDRLSAELKRIVKTAAVLGQEFATIILSTMLRKVNAEPEDELHRYLSAGEEQTIWTAISELRYIFRHALIRDAVYGMQLKKQLRALHNLAGEAIEELFQSNLSPYYVDLAEHYEKAERPEKAIFYLTLAGQAALDSYRNQQAIGLYDRLLQYPLPAEAELSAWENKGKAQRIAGDWQAARQTYAQMLARAEALDLPLWQAKAANALAYFLLVHGEIEQGTALAERAQRLAVQIGAREEQAQALRNLGIACNKSGAWSRAREIHTEMLALAKEIDDLSAIVSALFQLRQDLLEEGTLIPEFEKYLRRAEEKNDLRLVASLWFYIGDVYLLQHDYPAAEQANRHMYEIVYQIGDKHGMCYAIGDRGIVLSEQGRFEESIECYREKLALARELGDGYNLWEGTFNWAAVQTYQEKHAEALELLQAAAEIARKYTLKGELTLTLLALAENAWARGALAEARNALAEADALNADLGDETFSRQSRLLTAKLEHDLDLLDGLLHSARTDEERAELCFERWCMTHAEEDRQQALHWYQSIDGRFLGYTQKNRLAKLTAQA